MKSGFVAIIGKSNVGKSTILNELVEHKVAIVTDKVQTTRDIIKGIYNDEDSQIIFLDTPGIHKPLHELGIRMNDSALNAMKGVDAILLVVDASRKENKGDQIIYDRIKGDTPLFIAINKIDLITINEAVEIKNRLSERFPSATIIELEAQVGFNIPSLIEEIKKVLPEGPLYFPKEAVTDKSTSYLLGELIREALLNTLREEVPHGVAVYVANVAEDKNKVYIRAEIYVEKDSHKPILVGKRGSKIKSIGTKARHLIEEYYDKTVYLELIVLVKKDWQNSPSMLKKLGY